MVSIKATVLSTFVALAAASPIEKRASGDFGCRVAGSLSAVTYSYGFMTNEYCQSVCANAQYAYAGTYGGTTCVCDNFLTGLQGYDCVIPCAGNPFENCGGSLSLHVTGSGYTYVAPVVSSSSAKAASSSSIKLSSSSSSAAPVKASSTSSAVVVAPSSTSAAPVKASSTTSSAVVVAPSSTSAAPVKASSTSSAVVVAPSSSAAVVAPSSSAPQVTSSSSKAVVASSTTSTSSTVAAVVTPSVSATPVPGYTLEYSGLNAAANGAGYLTSYNTATYDINGCAASCTSNAACAFFNIYQEQLTSGSFDYVCVLWSQDQPTSVVTNTYNNGQPISYSAGYVKNVVVVSSSSSAAASSSSVAAQISSSSVVAQVSSSSTVAQTSSTTSAASTACATAAPVTGYTQEWSCLNGAADGAGYQSSYVSTFSDYSAATADCGASCTASSSCAFFNVYQENAGSTINNICGLWTQDKPASTATNTYNNGKPVSSSAGFFKIVNAVTSSSSAVASSTSSAAATSSSAASTTSATTPVQTAPAISGYTLEWTNQNAAADGANYLSSSVSSTYDANACAASCTASSSCAFFNIYQEQLASGSFDYVCVLWTTDKPLSTATNTYNNGQPITYSSGYVKVAGATSCTGLAPGYVTCYEGQKVQNGACVSA